MPLVARVFLAAALGLAAAAAGAAEPAGAGELERALAEFLGAQALRGARVGVAVEDLASGERLLDHTPDAPLVPASNQKLVIASAALAHWGPAHRFETPVLVEGTLEDGVLDGTLWLVGSGDPSLISESYWKLAEDVRLHGVREIRGGLGIDATQFDAVRFHPDWEPVSSRAYYAPVSALAANYSSFRVDVLPGPRLAGPVEVRLAPATPYFRVLPEAITLRGGGQLTLDVDVLADGTGESVRVTGSVSVGREPATYWRAVALPERYAAALLRAQLEAQGIRVGTRVRFAPAPPEARELFRFAGEPMALLVRLLGKYSNNFVAEQLTKRLGADVYGAPGTWEKGVRALEQHLESIGAADPATRIADGSGLSPRNRIAPATLTALIRSAASSFSYGPEFVASLPIGGRDGTLETRMEGVSGAAIRAKTGHLRRVTSLSGVVPGPGVERRAFSVLVNGARGNPLDVDAALDAFVARLGEPR